MSRVQFSLTPNLIKALAICACIAGLAMIQLSNPPAIPKTPSLDIAWLVSLPYMLSQGQLSGRDFFFTYGPLTQIINWAVARVTVSNSPLLAISTILLAFQIICWVFTGLVLWISTRSTWKTVLLVYGAFLIVATDWTFFRTSIALVIMAVLARTLLLPHARWRLIAAILVGILIVTAQLVILDVGLYTAVAGMAVLAGCAVLTRLPASWQRTGLLSTRDYMILLGLLTLTLVAGNIAIAVTFKLSSPAYQALFDYQRYSLESLRGYNLTMGAPWGMSILPTLSLFTLAAFCIIWLVRHWRTLDIASLYFFMCLMAPALLMIKSALVRSDVGHILLGFQPLVFLFVMIGSYLLESQQISKTWLALAALLLAVWPASSLNWLHGLARVVESPITYMKASQKYLTLGATQAQLLPENFPVTVVSPDAPVLAFPYENDFVVVLGNQLVAPVLQSYAAHTLLLQEKYVDGLKIAGPDLEIIYGMDAVVSAQIDGVQQVTRIPIIFEYIYSNFALVSSQAYGGGFYILKGRPDSRVLTASVLDASIQTPAAAHVLITAPAASACSLVRLTLRIDYPIWMALGRANSVQVSVSSGDAVIHQSNLVPIETGREFSTYISLIDPTRFYEVFSEEGAPPVPWTTVDLQPFSTGWFGVDASSIKVSKVECVDL